MNSIKLLAFLVIGLLSGAVNAQEFQDKLIKLNGDTVICNITHNAGATVFYEYQETKKNGKVKINKTFISAAELASIEESGKTISAENGVIPSPKHEESTILNEVYLPADELAMLKLKAMDFDKIKAQTNLDDYKPDVGGPYSPTLNGLLSFFIFPGVGQMAAGEYSRGMGFVLVEVSAYAIIYRGLVDGAIVWNNGFDLRTETAAGKVLLAGLALGTINAIASAADAGDISKRKNMMYHKLLSGEKETSCLSFRPTLLTFANDGGSVTPGLTLSIGL